MEGSVQLLFRIAFYLHQCRSVRRDICSSLAASVLAECITAVTSLLDLGALCLVQNLLHHLSFDVACLCRINARRRQAHT